MPFTRVDRELIRLIRAWIATGEIFASVQASLIADGGQLQCTYKPHRLKRWENIEMIRTVRAALYGASLLFFASCGAGHAADKPNVLVMGEDGDEQGAGTQTIAVARDTRVFNRVLEAITDELKQAGFDAFDERAIARGALKRERNETSLIDIARSVRQPPMDAVVIFAVYTGARKLAYTTEVYVRITSRILNVKTGEKLGGYEVTSPHGWRAPINCEQDCLVEAIGKNAMGLAGELGVTLARQLAVLKSSPVPAPRSAGVSSVYTLIFAGFTPDDLNGVEEYLVAFKGYKLHQPIKNASSGRQYRYESDSDSARLNRNLQMMLERLGAEGRISFSTAENTFTVENIRSDKAAAPASGRP
jgi:hypothetical protein